MRGSRYFSVILNEVKDLFICGKILGLAALAQNDRRGNRRFTQNDKWENRWGSAKCTRRGDGGAGFLKNVMKREIPP